MVDEADDFLLDNLEDFVVGEDDAMDADTQFVVEEEGDCNLVVDEADDAADQLVPGSNTMWVEDAPEEQKAKDWANDGAHAHFTQHLKDQLTKIPRHSGETVPGCERAKAFLKSLDSEISKAMRSDLKGEIDEEEVDTLRKSIEGMIDRLEKQLNKLTGTKRAALDVRLVSEGNCDKCESTAPMWHDVAHDELVCMSCDSNAIKKGDNIEKTAGSATINVYVSAFERAIVGTMINSKVSAGRNIEETYDKLKNKYNFTPREELAIQQLVSDYGYPVYKDRGLLNEPSDPASGDGVDWLTNYQA